MIRKVQPEDENILAKIQTESWKAAFSDILAPELLDKCTDLGKATAMYKQLLTDNIQDLPLKQKKSLKK